MDHSNFARTFGDHATPLEEAIRQTVRWYRQRHSGE
jgi:nucleoside-diphosphate-sugar epimerase